MSKYFVTSEPSHQYPFTFQDLRVRPPKKHSGLLIVTTACLSALCGGAAAYALMAGADDPAPVQVASLDTTAMIDSAIATKPMAESDVKNAAGTVEPVAKSIEPVAALEVGDQTVKLASASGSGDGLAPLGSNNPRWSDDLEAATGAVEKASNGETIDEALRGVAIAETEDEVVNLEERMNPGLLAFASPETREDPVDGVIADEPVHPVRISAPIFATGDLAPARATKWVNMRVAARKGAAKMMVVPENADILSDPSCDHWCRVVYDGRLGYVYRTYIRFPGENAVAANASEPVADRSPKKSEGGFFKKLMRGGRADP